MTSDELLTEIVSMGTGDSPEDLIDVFGVVIELHRSNYGLCKECTTSVVNIPYPCRTIQAIERELK